MNAPNSKCFATLELFEEFALTVMLQKNEKLVILCVTYTCNNILIRTI